MDLAIGGFDLVLWRGEECGRASHDAHLSAMKLREDGAPGSVTR